MSRSRAIMPVLVLSLSGCGFAAADIETVPEHPTYDTDVWPLLYDHCLLCHGARPSRGAPSYFRLDVYDDSDGIAGARTMARPALRLIENETMPPAAQRGDGVGPRGRELLRRWIDQGRPAR